MKALEDIIVISVEQAVAAPLCTARLVEAGATVIKIERSEGDFARGYDEAAKGESSYFVWINQGKQSVVLDLKDPKGTDVLKELISGADVFVQNLAPNALSKIGFGSEQLRKDFPALITLDISGYGEGPAAQKLKGYDLLVQAESGIVGISGGENEIGRVGISICDIGTGITAYSAILEALTLRQKTGEGSSLKISLFDVAAEWMSVPFIHAQYGDGAPKRVGLKHPSIAPYGAFETNERSLTVISIQNEREWKRLCEEVLAKPVLATDTRFKSNNLRVKNRVKLECEMSKIISQIDRDKFRNLLAEANIAYGAVNSVEELAEHPALRTKIIRNSKGNELSVPASPVIWPEKEANEISIAPKLGKADPWAKSLRAKRACK